MASLLVPPASLTCISLTVFSPLMKRRSNHCTSSQSQDTESIEGLQLQTWGVSVNYIIFASSSRNQESKRAGVLARLKSNKHQQLDYKCIVTSGIKTTCIPKSGTNQLQLPFKISNLHDFGRRLYHLPSKAAVCVFQK